MWERGEHPGQAEVHDPIVEYDGGGFEIPRTAGGDQETVLLDGVPAVWLEELLIIYGDQEEFFEREGEPLIAARWRKQADNLNRFITRKRKEQADAADGS
jgi:hypothetical protein